MICQCNSKRKCSRCKLLSSKLWIGIVSKRQKKEIVYTYNADNSLQTTDKPRKKIKFT